MVLFSTEDFLVEVIVVPRSCALRDVVKMVVPPEDDVDSMEVIDRGLLLRGWRKSVEFLGKGNVLPAHSMGERRRYGLREREHTLGTL